MALALARQGSHIVIADINDTRLANVQQEIISLGRRALTVHCDVSQTSDVENLAAQTLANMGTVDILMNNAGIAVYGSFENMHLSDYERVLNVNLLGVIRGVMAFLPYMIKRGQGYIINTSSQVGIDGGEFSGVEPYAFSKYTVLGFSERLYVYAKPKGVMVSVLCPSFVNTNLFIDSPFVSNEMKISENKKPGRVAPSMNMLNPDDVAQITISNINDNNFFILTPGTENIVSSTVKKGRDIHKLEKYFKDNF